MHAFHQLCLRALSEQSDNPIVSIHDHGAGGHLNCLSELVEATGGVIDIRKLPIGDPTLSDKEIVGNESQERMGLVLKDKDIDHLKKIADRERAPMYVVGEATGDMQFRFTDKQTNEDPINLQLADMFGNPPRTIMNDKTVKEQYADLKYDTAKVADYLEQVLQLESVACKDWLTNKVDRSVTGKVAMQQCAGPLHLPLNDCGVVALDYQGKYGVATSVGHAPLCAMINPAKGSRMAVAEALTNGNRFDVDAREIAQPQAVGHSINEEQTIVSRSFQLKLRHIGFLVDAAHYRRQVYAVGNQPVEDCTLLGGLVHAH